MRANIEEEEEEGEEEEEEEGGRGRGRGRGTGRGIGIGRRKKKEERRRKIKDEEGETLGGTGYGRWGRVYSPIWNTTFMHYLDLLPMCVATNFMKPVSKSRHFVYNLTLFHAFTATYCR